MNSNGDREFLNHIEFIVIHFFVIHHSFRTIVHCRFVLFMLKDVSMTVLYVTDVVHMTCRSVSDDAQSDLRPVAELLFDTSADEGDL